MLKHGNFPAKLLPSYRHHKQNLKVEHNRTYSFGKSVCQGSLYSITLSTVSRLLQHGGLGLLCGYTGICV